MGIVLLLLGVLAFIPGVTTQYGDMTFANGSGSMLFAVFQMSMLMNIINIVVGIIGVLMARTAATARDFTGGAGILYLLFWIYGLVTVNMSGGANFFAFNVATVWLNFVLGIIMLGLCAVYMTRHHGGTARSQ